MRYLTVAEALDIHTEVMGEHAALRDQGLLESAVARPQAGAFGRDAYPDAISKAAALMHSVVLNHARSGSERR